MNISKTWIWIIIIIAALTFIGWAAWQYGFLTLKTEERFQSQPLLGGDTTTDIGNDLNSVDIGDPSQDLKQMDADINGL